MSAIPLQQLHIEDLVLIQDTIARYNRSIDAGDRGEYLSLFTKDAIKENLNVWGTLRGIEEIARAFDEYSSSPSFANFRDGQHWVTNLIIDDVKAGRVETWSNYAFWVPTPDGPKLLVMGTYHDVFVKQDGRWLFEKRVIKGLLRVDRAA